MNALNQVKKNVKLEKELAHTFSKAINNTEKSYGATIRTSKKKRGRGAGGKKGSIGSVATLA